MPLAVDLLEEDVRFQGGRLETVFDGHRRVVGAVDDHHRTLEASDNRLEGIPIEIREEPLVDRLFGFESEGPSRSAAARVSAKLRLSVTGARVAIATSRGPSSPVSSGAA